MKKLLKVICTLLVIVLLIGAGGIGFLTLKEYKPAQNTRISIIQNSLEKTVDTNKDLSVLTWNIGYGALGEDADFFMDGGKSVMTASKDEVKENMEAIRTYAASLNPDFALFQEVDQKSKRSHKVNEVKKLNKVFKDYSSSYALNYKCRYVPYPIPPIGKVQSGIDTYSKYRLVNSYRYSLPVPFKWPTRVANLKRCLSINRIKVKDSDKELVLINLHLEAYDDGEGRKEQLKVLKEVMDKEVKKGNYVVAGGDFNQTFSNVKQYKTYPDNWQPLTIDVKDFSDYTLSMDASTPTCRSLKTSLKDTEQYYCIDGFITSPNIKVNSIKTMDQSFKNSDHNPVVMHYELIK